MHSNYRLDEATRKKTNEQRASNMDGQQLLFLVSAVKKVKTHIVHNDRILTLEKHFCHSINDAQH